jgi:hypothetical protein
MAGLVTAFVCFMALLTNRLPEKFGKATVRVSIWSAAFTVLNITIVVSAMAIYSLPAYDQAVYLVLDDGSLEHKPEGAICARWFGRKCFVGTRYSVAVHNAVTAVTDNPKLRKIDITVRTRVIDYPRFWNSERAKMRTCGRGESHTLYTSAGFFSPECTEDQMALVTAYHLTEMMNSQSKALSVFYNHLDPIQREQVDKLVKDSLNPKLAEQGLEVASTSFIATTP